MWSSGNSDGQNAKWYRHLENSVTVLKKIDILLSYDPAILFLGINSREMESYIHKDLGANVYNSIIPNN